MEKKKYRVILEGWLLGDYRYPGDVVEMNDIQVEYERHKVQLATDPADEAEAPAPKREEPKRQKQTQPASNYTVTTDDGSIDGK